MQPGSEYMKSSLSSSSKVGDDSFYEPFSMSFPQKPAHKNIAQHSVPLEVVGRFTNFSSSGKYEEPQWGYEPRLAETLSLQIQPRDEETGYSYFGARYYDAEILMGWLSVDPMADKYPGISPYAYCAWNPVKLVDSDGRDWYRYTETMNGKSSYKYYWKEGHAKSIKLNGHTFENVGAYASVRQKDGNYNNYYQQVCIGHSATRQSTKELSHFLHSRAGSGVRARLLGKESPLSRQSQIELFQSQVTSSHQFYKDAHDIAVYCLTDGLTEAGTAATAMGLAITPMAPEAGLPIMAVGNCMTATGGTITALKCLINEDVKGAVINEGAVLMGSLMKSIKPHPDLTPKQVNCLEGAWNLYWDINPAHNEALKQF